MAKRTVRKPTLTYRATLKRGHRMRITMPQPPERPLSIRARDVVRRELIQPESWWYTLHRRGPRRPRVGVDPLEARAVPHSSVRGTLPERIVYKALMKFNQKPGIDFEFQSSLQGGRMELGGIVADFIFPYHLWVWQVQGPTHNQFLRATKDKEQWQALEEMGYRVFFIDDDLIYDSYRLESWMRRTFGLASGVGQAQGGGLHFVQPQEEAIEPPDYSTLWQQIADRIDWINAWAVNYA